MGSSTIVGYEYLSRSLIPRIPKPYDMGTWLKKNLIMGASMGIATYNIIKLTSSRKFSKITTRLETILIYIYIILRFLL